MTGIQDSGPCTWSVAIFSARETPEELFAALRAVIAAVKESAVVDILVNGNPLLASEVSRLIAEKNLSDALRAPLTLRVWHIELGSKAHAWNQYVYRIHPESSAAFFVDGYVFPAPDAFEKLVASLTSHPNALASAGTPSIGRTAARIREEMLRDGGLHGNLFAMSQSALNTIRLKGFALPLGLYSFDTILCAVLAYGLDPLRNRWNIKEYIVADPEATWTNKEKKWWRYSDLKTQFRRYLNIAQRVLERQATIYYLQRSQLPVEEFPKKVDNYVLAWMDACPDEARKTLWRSPFSRIALNRIKQPKDWSLAERPPELLYVRDLA